MKTTFKENFFISRFCICLDLFLDMNNNWKQRRRKRKEAFNSVEIGGEIRK